MVSVDVTGAEALDARLDGLQAAVLALVAARSAALADQLRSLVHAKLSGGVLQSRTGALAGSIVVDGPRLEGDGVVVSVCAGADLKYAAIQEYGGTTSPHEIAPSKARALAFLAGGAEAFAKVVHHPGSRLPERSYLRASMAEMAADIESGLKSAVIEAVRTRMEG